VVWTVETLNATVDLEIATMPSDMQAAFLRLAERIEAVGLERIQEPHVKHLRRQDLGDAVRRRDGIGRALYVTSIGRRVVVVHAFVKKTQKTPKSALDLAERRTREIK
jgi:phage-related protein